MAEVEFGGLKFTGGKMFVLLTALSTLGGAAWGGFEFYNDYRILSMIKFWNYAKDLDFFYYQTYAQILYDIYPSY